MNDLKNIRGKCEKNGKINIDQNMTDLLKYEVFQESTSKREIIPSTFDDNIINQTIHDPKTQDFIYLS